MDIIGTYQIVIYFIISISQGPECESLEIAHIGDKVVLFVRNERPGSIFIYMITDDVSKPKFESIWTGIEETDGTWSELYERRKISEMDPEDIRFVYKSVDQYFVYIYYRRKFRPWSKRAVHLVLPVVCDCYVEHEHTKYYADITFWVLINNVDF